MRGGAHGAPPQLQPVAAPGLGGGGGGPQQLPLVGPQLPVVGPQMPVQAALLIGQPVLVAAQEPPHLHFPPNM